MKNEKLVTVENLVSDIERAQAGLIDALDKVSQAIKRGDRGTIIGTLSEVIQPQFALLRDAAELLKERVEDWQAAANWRRLKDTLDSLR